MFFLFITTFIGCSLAKIYWKNFVAHTVMIVLNFVVGILQGTDNYYETVRK